MFHYQKTHRFFAQIAQGFDEIVQKELCELGAEQIQSAHRGLHFSADLETLYRINYRSRLVSRILAPLAVFTCRDRNDLYTAAKALFWPALFSLDQTFGVLANVSGNENLRHSKFAALCIKDAVADRFRTQYNQRPNVDKHQPDIWIHLYLEKDQATISLDTSGGALHRRGYRRETMAAPMKETLAAAMITLSGWQAERPLYDPMCGSGTLLCEAIMAARNMPAGYLRSSFGFFHLPEFNPDRWQAIQKRIDAQIRPMPAGQVSGSDLDMRAVKAARINCGKIAGHAKHNVVPVTRKAFQDIPQLENHTIVCNPPYGIRLNNPEQLGPFYKELGDFLKQRCKGSDAYIFFGNREMIKKIGLRPTWKKPMYNAGLDGRVVKYELY